MRLRRQRGLALASVLWGVLILSLIAAAMLTQSVTSARIDHNAWAATKAGAIADEAVNRAILELMDTRAQPRVDGTRTALRIEETPVQLWIQDESGKINLNYADKSLLKDLFVSAGMRDDDADALADRIVARRTVSGSTSVAPFRSIEELLDIPGVSRVFYDGVAPALTVYGKSPSVNQSVAPRAVLRALPGLDEHAIDDLLRDRDRAYARQSQQATSTPLAASNAAFLITAEVDLGGAHVVRAAAVQFTGDETKPYLVMAWR